MSGFDVAGIALIVLCVVGLYGALITVIVTSLPMMGRTGKVVGYTIVGALTCALLSGAFIAIGQIR